MRILLVANTLPPDDVSGVGEQVLQLAAGLRDAGHEVEVLGRGPGGARGPKVLFPLAVVLPTWRALRRFRPHVVQVHESDGGLAALLVRTLAARLDPVPHLVTLLQVSYREERRAVRPLVDRGRVIGRPGAVERRFRWLKAPLQIALGCLTADLADRVLAPSRRTAAEIERDYAVGPVAVVPNVTGGLNRSPEIAGGAGFAPGYFLFVGRLRLRKGLEVLLHAMASAELRDRGARLLVAGDGEHAGRMRELAAELDLGEAVRFLGRASPERVRSLLADARALVVPSIYEGMPLVVLEAMAAAKPVVASAVSGIPEVVVDGETGWLVPPEDVAALSAALVAALDDAEAVRRGWAGRARLDARYRPRHAVAAWLGAALPPDAGNPDPGPPDAEDAVLRSSAGAAVGAGLAARKGREEG